MVIGLTAVPWLVRYSSVPDQVSPPLNRTVSPGLRGCALTLATVSQGRAWVPGLESDPTGLALET